MRVSKVWITAPGLLLSLASAGCPKAPVVVSPSVGADGVRVGKLARVLRAADRRIVDDDLLALVRDDDALVRGKAVLALGQIADARTRPSIEEAAGDADASVRARAAFALGLLADRGSREVVERLAADASAPVRSAAAEALGRIGDPASTPWVGKLLDDTDASVVVAAALAAWKFPEPEVCLDGLERGLAADADAVRAAAGYALARLAAAGVAPATSGAPVGRLSPAGVDRARAALRTRGADPDPEVRMQVARGLAAPRSPGEIAMVGALSLDRDPRVRVNAVRSLGYPGIPIDPHLNRAATDRDFGVARIALESLGKAGGARAAEKLNEVIFKLEGSWLREPALISLIQVEPFQAPEIVEGLIVNPDPVMRAAAAPLLAGHKESRALRAVLALAADPEPRVQIAAIPLIADQDGPISALLRAFFASGDPVVRATVAEAVGMRFERPLTQVESRDDLYALLEGLWASAAQDALPDAKLAVLDAAAKAGRDDRTRAILERGLADADVVVRRRAAARFQSALGEDRSSAIGPASEMPIAYYEEIVRWSLVPHAAVVTLRRGNSLPGRFALALDAQAAPMAAWNFAQLAAKLFYDARTVHRVVPNFVVQDGDPRGDGYGGPGYSIRDEFNPLAFTAGVLGMASDGKDTAGSQWFVTLSAQPHLDGRYTSFGKVTQGLRDVVSQMLPGDEVMSIMVYDGDGTEPLPKD